MCDAVARLCGSEGAGIVELATGGAASAASASDRGPEPSPTPSDLPPRPAADSPDAAPLGVSSLEWRIATRDLQVRIGLRAWSIWLELVELRDEAGDCRATAAGLGRRLLSRLTRGQVQEQLDRLRRLGLIAGGGWRYAEVPTGAGRQLMEVYERRVIGDRLGGRVGLPAEVWVELDRPRGWGGARAGAGRRRRPIQDRSGCPQSTSEAHQQPSLSDLENPEIHRESVSRKCSESLAKNSRSLTEVRDKEKVPSSLFSLRKKEIALPRDSSPSGVQKPAGATAPAGAEEVQMEASTELVEAGLPGVLAGDGISLEGCGVRVEVSAADWGELPPYPGVEVVQPAVVPGPPRIKPETPEEDRVQLCLQAYSLTCRRLLPGVFNPHDRHPLKAAERKLLLAAADALCNHEVSPLRWVEFSVDQWRVTQQAAAEAAAAKGGTGRKRKALARPPLKVVFAVSRIEEHAGWCRRERERRVQQVLITRGLRTVTAKWQQMRAAILRGEMTPSAAREKFFPGDSYQRQIDRARDEARRERERIASSLAAGDYLW